MGADCLATTPNEVYHNHFEGIKPAELKDHWSTVQVYKIKKIYDKASEKHPDYSKHTHITFEKFKTIFPELASYEQGHKRRVFQVFDYDSQGFLDWNNFYSVISICYFADTNFLAVLMFMIFDDSLGRQLGKEQLKKLCESNKTYIQQNIENQESNPMYEPEEIVDQLTKSSSKLGIDVWIKKAANYFDLNRFRTIFNIFVEEKLQKKLVSNFNEWNDLYSEKEGRYISYLISYKWFQSWKIYVLEAYGKTLYAKTGKSQTMKTIKTRKMLKTQKSINHNKIANTHHLRQLKIEYEARSQEVDVPEEINNFDFVHSNIGQRPRQIYNNVLEGEYEEVLKAELVENRDYVLVSEKVWTSLKAIYDGFPEFRRTGYDFIELYPKILKIYSQLFKGSLDYSSQIMREVSSYLSVSDLLLKSIQVKKDDLPNKSVFFKTIGKRRWEEITDLDYMFTQLTPQVIIFIVYIDKSDVQQFKKSHAKVAKEIVNINVGDQIIYESTVQGIKSEKNAIFMGKNNQGKYVLHMPGQSYIYDIAIMQQELYKKCSISSSGKGMIEEIKLKKKSELDLIGIPNTKGIGFINSVILTLLSNRAFRDSISFVSIGNQEINKIVQVLSHINSLISSKKKVDSMDILDMVEIMLSDFQSFEIGMCYSFLKQFLEKIESQFVEMKLKNVITEEFRFKTQKTIKCGKCGETNTLDEDCLFLSVPIPEQNEKYFQIIFVPYCQNFRSLDIKRYGFSLPRNATLKKYKQSFQKLAEISTNYILVEVYNNNIIKNYSTTNDNVFLSQIHLRDTDAIYAFELCVNFDKFIAEHYTTVKDITSKEFRVDQFIDCKNQERGWIFGKISQVEFLPYTHRTMFRVIHKFSKNEQWQISYDLYEGGICNFPTRSYLNGQQYHIRLLQRYFNEPSNEMQICNIPLVVVLTNWMRWKEFYYLIYLQVKRFIADQHKFQDEDHDQENVKIYSTKTIDAPKSPKSKNATKKIRLNKFKEYLHGGDFPYHVSFVDRDGRCAICFKFLKAKVLKGEAQSFCEGCSLSYSQPISWQIRPSDVMICIDWKNINKMKKNAVKDHSSYANLLTSKKNDVETLQNCVKNKLNVTYSEEIETYCCNQSILSEIHEKMIKNPQILTIYLQRVLEEEGFKMVINKRVQFQMEQYDFNGQKYKLTGLTSVQGGNKNVQYKTYTLNIEGQWIEYDGEIAKIVKKNVVQKACAFVLYYRKD